jgi:hypothetical protein
LKHDRAGQGNVGEHHKRFHDRRVFIPHQFGRISPLLFQATTQLSSIYSPPNNTNTTVTKATMTGSVAREDKLLGVMLGHIMQGRETVSFTQLSEDLGFMDRTTSWRNSWKVLFDDKKFVELAEGGKSIFKDECRMTQAGKDHAATPEYLEFMKELNFVPKTNKDHQARLKKRMLNDRAVQIFELLLKHGPLSRRELSSMLHCNDRQHKFSYGLKDLKTKNLVEVVEVDGKKKLILSDKAFRSPEDRPKAVPIDPTILEEGVRAVESKKRSAGKMSEEAKEGNDGKKHSKEKKSKKEAKVAEPNSTERNDEDSGEAKEGNGAKKHSKKKKGNKDEVKVEEQNNVEGSDEESVEGEEGNDCGTKHSKKKKKGVNEDVKVEEPNSTKISEAESVEAKGSKKKKGKNQIKVEEMENIVSNGKE